MIDEVPFDSKKLKLHHQFESIDTEYIDVLRNLRPRKVEGAGGMKEKEIKLEEIDVFLTLSGEGGGRVQGREKSQ
jgi:hypothetical protein